MKSIVLSLILIVSLCAIAGADCGGTIVNGDACYVSDQGTDDDTCGEIGTPCFSLGYMLDNRVGEDVDSTVTLLYGSSGIVASTMGTNERLSRAGNITIQAEDSHYGVEKGVQLDLSDPVEDAYLAIHPGTGKQILWRGIRFVFSDESDTDMLYPLDGDDEEEGVVNYVFEDCKIGDFNPGADGGAFLKFHANNQKGIDVTFRRCLIYDQCSTHYWRVLGGAQVDADFAITLESNLVVFKGWADATNENKIGEFCAGGEYVSAFTVKNNTFVVSTQAPRPWLFTKNLDLSTPQLTAWEVYNNVFYTLAEGSDLLDQHVVSWASFDGGASTLKDQFTNNIYWTTARDRANISIRSSYFYEFWYQKQIDTNGLIVQNHTNHLFDPGFTVGSDLDLSDYIVSNSSNALGQGVASQLPAGGDFNGTAWIGPHVGHLSNTGVTDGYVPEIENPSLNQGTLLLVGGTINECPRITEGHVDVDFTMPAESCAYYTSGTVAGSSSMDNMGIMWSFFAIDDLIERYAPEYLVMMHGENNIKEDQTGGETEDDQFRRPVGFTYDEWIAQNEEIIKKCESYGVKPIWVGGKFPVQAYDEDPDPISAYAGPHIESEPRLTGTVSAVSGDTLTLSVGVNDDQYNSMRLQVDPDGSNYTCMISDTDGAGEQVTCKSQTAGTMQTQGVQVGDPLEIWADHHSVNLFYQRGVSDLYEEYGYLHGLRMEELNTNPDYFMCESDGGYYQDNECNAGHNNACGNGGDCLSQNAAYGTIAADLTVDLINSLYIEAESQNEEENPESNAGGGSSTCMLNVLLFGE